MTANTVNHIPWDIAFKRFFSHDIIVKSLLHSFLDQELIGKLDFDTLQPCGTNFLTEDMRQLFGDSLWKIKMLHVSWMFCYVILEFQRTVDKTMSLRIAEYGLQLIMALYKAGEISLDGDLPPVLPLLLNISGRRWTAATSIEEMRKPLPEALRQFQLHQSYLLINAKYSTKENADSLAKIVLASCDAKPSVLPSLFSKALQLIINQKDRVMLNRLFVDWFNTLLKNKGHGELDNQLEIQEASKMIEDRIKEWEEEVYNQGFTRCETLMSNAVSNTLQEMGMSQDFASQVMQMALAKIGGPEQAFHAPDQSGQAQADL